VKLVTSSEMREIDERTAYKFKIPMLDLMEAAGRGAARVIERRLGPLGGKRIVVLAGKGNNGGDGFVAARHLREAGAEPRVFLFGKASDLKGDSKESHARWTGTGGGVQEVGEGPGGLRALEEALKDADLAVDALLGTGTKGEVQGPMAAAIETLNRSGLPVAALDIPSGVNGDDGSVQGPAVRATFTVAMELPKRGHLIHPGRSHTGDLEVVDLGFPAEALEAQRVRTHLPTREEAARLLPVWAPTAHKGLRGRLLVVGGSTGLTGAVAMAATSALRAGAGLVTAGVPRSLHDILEVKLTEAITLPLVETENRTLALEALSDIEGVVKERRIDALAFGPGLSRDPSTEQLVRALVKRASLPMVLDADALNAFEGKGGSLKGKDHPLVLTPHVGEMARISGYAPEEIESRRLDLAGEWAKKHKVVLVLKGAPTVVGDVTGDAWVNPTGNAVLATAGSGDVLTGLIGGLLAQGVGPRDAAILGVFLHGLTADRIAARRGIYGTIAGDLVEEIPGAMNELRNALGPDRRGGAQARRSGQAEAPSKAPAR
jgi:NAD(P)H-hydrate epimerase